jgi:hypothetical protein
MCLCLAYLDLVTNYLGSDCRHCGTGFIGHDWMASHYLLVSIDSLRFSKAALGAGLVYSYARQEDSPS